MSASGRYLEIKRAVLPDSVSATTSLISIELVASLTADATTSVLLERPNVDESRRPYSLRRVCAFLSIVAIVRTDSTGYLPFADSPESIVASVPSITALNTSDTSERVARGLSVIVSSMFVAVTAILPAALTFVMIIFW